jgi:hypothetical protein
LEESPLTVRGLGAGFSSSGKAKLTLRFFFKFPAREERLLAGDVSNSGLEGSLEEPLEAIEWRYLIGEELDTEPFRVWLLIEGSLSTASGL